MYRQKKAVGTTAVVAVIIVIVLVAGGLYYYVSSSSPVTSTTSSSSQSTSTPTTSSSSPSTSSSTTSTSSHTPTTSPSSSTSSTSSSISTPSSTSTTQPSSSTSSSTSSTTSSSSTASCSTTQTSTTSTTIITQPQNFAPLLAQFSAMTIGYSGTSDSQAYNLTSSYSIVSRSAGAYVVNVTELSVSDGQTSNETVTAWLQSDGTVTAVGISGYNLTGSEAASIFGGFMAPFAAEIASASQVETYTSSASFHVINQTSVTLGTTTISVTNYAANALPTTVETCNGTFTLTGYLYQTGTVPGTNTKLVTLQSFQGTDTTSSGTTTFNSTIKVLSITKA